VIPIEVGGVAAVAVASTVIQSASGLGFSIVLVPVLLLVDSPRDAVVVALILNTSQCLIALAASRTTFDRAAMTPLLLGALVATPLGAIAAKHIMERELRVVVALILVAAALPMLIGGRIRIARELRASIVAASLAGFLNGTSGLSGPPLALYLTNQRWSRDGFKLALYSSFVVSNAAALTTLVALGSVSATAVDQAFVLLPAVAVGWLIFRSAERRLARVSARGFSRAVVTIALFAGFATLARAL
jgi:uncharacterized protein